MTSYVIYYCHQTLRRFTCGPKVFSLKYFLIFTSVFVLILFNFALIIKTQGLQIEIWKLKVLRHISAYFGHQQAIFFNKTATLFLK
jgi:hypothetical protein